MKKTLLPLLLLLSFAACKKAPLDGTVSPTDVSLPAMRSIDLHDAIVHAGQTQAVDLDGDGAVDFRFKMQLVGDPLLQVDKHQFCVTSGIQRNLLVNEQDETLPFGAATTIAPTQPGFNWYEVGLSVLAEKIVGNTETWWDGLWKTAQHRFLAVQVQRGDLRYMGWIELSMDRANEKLVLHRAALNLSPNVAIVTGR
ncbi:MAG: hypothetical protein EOP50_11385 [Sphingobacteriales bacterium]|nr:MAG: hypothetical protein EOP50_11385 [Sphingobacteriales bacterium]